MARDYRAEAQIFVDAANKNPDRADEYMWYARQAEQFAQQEEARQMAEGAAISEPAAYAKAGLSSAAHWAPMLAIGTGPIGTGVGILDLLAGHPIGRGVDALLGLPEEPAPGIGDTLKEGGMMAALAAPNPWIRAAGGALGLYNQMTKGQRSLDELSELGVETGGLGGIAQSTLGGVIPGFLHGGDPVGAWVDTKMMAHGATNFPGVTGVAKQTFTPEQIKAFRQQFPWLTGDTGLTELSREGEVSKVENFPFEGPRITETEGVKDYGKAARETFYGGKAAPEAPKGVMAFIRRMWNPEEAMKEDVFRQAAEKEGERPPAMGAPASDKLAVWTDYFKTLWLRDKPYKAEGFEIDPKDFKTADAFAEQALMHEFGHKMGARGEAYATEAGRRAAAEEKMYGAPEKPSVTPEDINAILYGRRKTEAPTITRPEAETLSSGGPVEDVNRQPSEPLTSVTNYQEALRFARKEGLVTGKNPPKEALKNIIKEAGYKTEKDAYISERPPVRDQREALKIAQELGIVPEGAKPPKRLLKELIRAEGIKPHEADRFFTKEKKEEDRFEGMSKFFRERILGEKTKEGKAEQAKPGPNERTLRLLDKVPEMDDYTTKALFERLFPGESYELGDVAETVQEPYRESQAMITPDVNRPGIKAPAPSGEGKFVSPLKQKLMSRIAEMNPEKLASKLTPRDKVLPTVFREGSRDKYDKVLLKKAKDALREGNNVHFEYDATKGNIGPAVEKWLMRATEGVPFDNGQKLYVHISKDYDRTVLENMLAGKTRFAPRDVTKKVYDPEHTRAYLEGRTTEKPTGVDKIVMKKGTRIEGVPATSAPQMVEITTDPMPGSRGAEAVKSGAEMLERKKLFGAAGEPVKATATTRKTLAELVRKGTAEPVNPPKIIGDLKPKVKGATKPMTTAESERGAAGVEFTKQYGDKITAAEKRLEYLKKKQADAKEWSKAWWGKQIDSTQKELDLYRKSNVGKVEPDLEIAGQKMTEADKPFMEAYPAAKGKAEVFDKVNEAVEFLNSGVRDPRTRVSLEDFGLWKDETGTIMRSKGKALLSPEDARAIMEMKTPAEARKLVNEMMGKAITENTPIARRLPEIARDFGVSKETIKMAERASTPEQRIESRKRIIDEIQEHNPFEGRFFTKERKLEEVEDWFRRRSQGILRASHEMVTDIIQGTVDALEANYQNAGGENTSWVHNVKKTIRDITKGITDAIRIRREVSNTYQELRISELRDAVPTDSPLRMTGVDIAEMPKDQRMRMAGLTKADHAFIDATLKLSEKIDALMKEVYGKSYKSRQNYVTHFFKPVVDKADISSVPASARDKLAASLLESFESGKPIEGVEKMSPAMKDIVDRYTQANKELVELNAPIMGLEKAQMAVSEILRTQLTKDLDVEIKTLPGGKRAPAVGFIQKRSLATHGKYGIQDLTEVVIRQVEAFDRQVPDFQVYRGMRKLFADGPNGEMPQAKKILPPQIFNKLRDNFEAAETDKYNPGKHTELGRTSWFSRGMDRLFGTETYLNPMPNQAAAHHLAGIIYQNLLLRPYFFFINQTDPIFKTALSYDLTKKGELAKFWDVTIGLTRRMTTGYALNRWLGMKKSPLHRLAKEFAPSRHHLETILVSGSSARKGMLAKIPGMGKARELWEGMGKWIEGQEHGNNMTIWAIEAEKLLRSGLTGKQEAIINKYGSLIEAYAEGGAGREAVVKAAEARGGEALIKDLFAQAALEMKRAQGHTSGFGGKSPVGYGMSRLGRNQLSVIPLVLAKMFTNYPATMISQLARFSAQGQTPFEILGPTLQLMVLSGMFYGVPKIIKAEMEDDKTQSKMRSLGQGMLSTMLSAMFKDIAPIGDLVPLSIVRDFKNIGTMKDVTGGMYGIGSKFIPGVFAGSSTYRDFGLKHLFKEKKP